MAGPQSPLDEFPSSRSRLKFPRTLLKFSGLAGDPIDDATLSGRLVRRDEPLLDEKVLDEKEVNTEKEIA
jgi:hypothetical protein